MSLRGLFVLVLGALLASCLVACGGGSGESDATQPEPEVADLSLEDGGGISVSVSPDSRIDPADLRLAVLPERPTWAIGHVYEAGPSGTTFDLPTELSIRVPPAALDRYVMMPTRIVTSQDGEQWEALPPTDGPGAEVTAEVEHFSLFAAAFDPAAELAFSEPATGTSFQAGPVPLETSRDVELASMSANPTMIALVISSPTPGPVMLKFQGLVPGAQLYFQEGSLTNGRAVFSDPQGVLRVNVEVDSTRKAFWIQRSSSTLVIDSNFANGGDCESGAMIGDWDSVTRTCTLNQDVIEAVELRGDDTKLDCQEADGFTRHRITPLGLPGVAVAVAPNTSGVQVTNCTIVNPGPGILVSSGTTDVTLENNTIVNSEMSEGIRLLGTGPGVVVTDNDIRAWDGIVLDAANGPEVSGNSLSGRAGVQVLGLTREARIEGNAFAADVDTSSIVPPVLFVLVRGITLAGGSFATEVIDNTFTISQEPTPLLASTAIRSFPGQLLVSPSVIRGNTIDRFDDGLFLTADASVEVSRNRIFNNDTGIRILDDGFNVGNIDVFLNDVVNNDAPQVVSDIDIQLSADVDGTPRGNFWGRACPGGTFFFDASLDSNRTGAIDGAPFGLPVAGIEDGLASLPDAPGCNMIDPLTADADADGDGFTDKEEVDGITGPDGFLNLPLLGANPLVPDVFVEVDHMPRRTTTPREEAIQMVVDSFARQGIALHVDLGEAGTGKFRLPGWDRCARRDADPSLSCTVVPEYDSCVPNGKVPGGLFDFRVFVYEFSICPFLQLKNQSFDDRRKQAFHYAIYGRGSAKRSDENDLRSVTLWLDIQPGASQVVVREFVDPRFEPSRLIESDLSEGPGVMSFENDRFEYTAVNSEVIDPVQDDPFNDDVSICGDFSGESCAFEHTLTVPSPMTPGDDGPGIDAPHTFFTAVYPVLGMPSGRAEIDGNDFVVTSSVFYNGGSGPTLIEEATTFMHELGHNFNLLHGGDVSVPEYKPNYLSVMTYQYQPEGLKSLDGCPPLALDPSLPAVDFSSTVIDLDETSLNETDGLGPLAPDLAVHWTCDEALGGSGPSCALASGPINWDCVVDPAPSFDVIAADVSRDGALTVLEGHDDWAEVRSRLSIRDRLNFVGSSSGALPEELPGIDLLNQDFGIEINIVIRASGASNRIPIRGNGVVHLALLSTDDFDAPVGVDTSTVKAGITGVDASAERCEQIRDVDHDGLDDLVCRFRAKQLGLTSGGNLLRLTARMVQSPQKPVFGSTTAIGVP